MTRNTFDEHHVLHELKHFLPTQTPLKDFIHHNSLHAFQSEKFYDAIFKSSKVFGHQATMPLSDYRKLYEIGRIRPEILEKSIENRKSKEVVDFWKTKLISTDYDDHNEQRIGKLRSQWKQNYHIDLDNLVQPFSHKTDMAY